MLDIKPCPFCKYENPSIVYLTGKYFTVAWVTCPNCEAQGPHESIPFGITEQEAAIQAWNER